MGLRLRPQRTHVQQQFRARQKAPGAESFPMIQFPACKDRSSSPAVTLFIAMMSLACSNLCAKGQGVIDTTQRSMGQPPSSLVVSESNAVAAASDLPDAPAPAMQEVVAPAGESASPGESADVTSADSDTATDPAATGVL